MTMHAATAGPVPSGSTTTAAEVPAGDHDSVARPREPGVGWVRRRIQTVRDLLGVAFVAMGVLATAAIPAYGVYWAIRHFMAGGGQ